MDDLVGREPEQRAISTLAATARAGRLQVVGIEGPMGMGKSALLEDQVAALTGWQVLRCHLDPSRSSTRLTAVAELFEPLGWDPSEADAEPSRTAHRIRERVEDLGVPVCLAVEDAHWLDHPSTDVLVQLVRQMRDLPVLVVMTCRPATGEAPERFERIAHEPRRGRWITLGPMSLDGVGALLARHLTVAPDQHTLARIVDVTGGYPIHLEELVHRLGASDDPTHTLGTTLAELRDSPPDRMLTERVALRLAENSPSTRAAMLALSVGEELTWEQVEAVVARRGLPGPRLNDLIHTELVFRTPRDTLRPRHAMIANAVIGDADGDAVRATHLALAEVLTGTPALQHRVRAARHLDDDPELVAALEHRSLEHLILGDAELSFALALDAAVLDPSRTLNAAITAMRVRRLDLAVALEGPAAGEDRPLQQLALRALLAAAHEDHDRIPELLARIDPAECDDETLTVLAYAAHEFARLSVKLGLYRAASTTTAILDELVARRSRAIDAGMPPEFLGEFSNLIGLLRMWWLMADLDPRDGAPLIHKMLELEDDLRGWPRTEPTLAVARAVRSSFQLYSGSYDVAASGFDGIADAPVDPDFILQMNYGRFQLLFQAGRWDEAVLAARHALGRTMERLNDAGRMRLIAAARGVDRCRGEVPPSGEEHAPRPRSGQALVGAARAVAAAWSWVCVGGEPLQVAEDLEQAWRDGPGGAYAGGLPIAVLRVRAYLDAGEPDLARMATLDLPDGSYDEAARAYVIAHAEALVTAAEDVTSATGHFEAAAEAMARHLHEQPGHGLRVFHALLAEDRVEHLLRHGLPVPEDARAALAMAVETVRDAGSRPWRTRLAALLRRTADTASAPFLAPAAESAAQDLLDELTSREREISWLVADGLTNREIAAELFLSVRTVETHVARALRKLDCESRVELRRTLRTASRAS